MRPLPQSAAFVLLLHTSIAIAGDFTGRAVGITDGDTIKVLDAGREVRVRVHGIDSPEKRQPFGQKANEYASSLPYGMDVIVRETAVDRYGRKVAWWVILPDGWNLNKATVRAGFTSCYRKYAPGDSDLSAWRTRPEPGGVACGGTGTGAAVGVEAGEAVERLVSAPLAPRGRSDQLASALPSAPLIGRSTEPGSPRRRPRLTRSEL